MSERPARTVASIEDLLVKTSRTFALSIPLLPEPTRREVGVAYLLFRIADTLEDATEWSPGRQVAELGRFRDLLDAPETAAVSGLVRDWVDDPPLHHDGYLELLGELGAVIDAFSGLSPEAQALIRTHTQRTTDRMAAFVDRRQGKEALQIADISDLQDYCYAVAGIVGEMLTELFVLGCSQLESVAGSLRKDAATFGEALQLVNIVKDAATDLVEGRSFLPRQTERSEVFSLARDDLATAAAYVARLQTAGAPRGVIEFCALPVLLAGATLDRVESEGPGSKLTRPEVTEIIGRMAAALDDGQPVVPVPPTD